MSSLPSSVRDRFPPLCATHLSMARSTAAAASASGGRLKLVLRIRDISTDGPSRLPRAVARHVLETGLIFYDPNAPCQIQGSHNRSILSGSSAKSKYTRRLNGATPRSSRSHRCARRRVVFARAGRGDRKEDTRTSRSYRTGRASRPCRLARSMSFYHPLYAQSTHSNRDILTCKVTGHRDSALASLSRLLRDLIAPAARE